jgi:hypothetical protein
MTHEASAAITPENIFPPTLEGNIAFWEERVTRLEAEAPTLAGSNAYPEWFFQDGERLREVVPQLNADGADLSNASKLYDLTVREAELRSVITGRPPLNRPIQNVAYRLGDQLMGKVLKAEPIDGTIHTAMLDNISQSIENRTALKNELNALKEAYSVPTVTDLLGIGGDEFSNKLRDLLLQDDAIRWIRHIDQEQDADFKWSETQEAARIWMSKAVQAASAMPADEALDYVFTASRHGADADIISIIKKFDHFGVDRIRQLSKATGIHGLEAYTIAQLGRMEKFMQDPSGVAEQLASHDVIAVLVNRVGDHNGVMHDVADNFDDDKKRVLFFEINRLDDIYRRMATLHKAGIKPSTIVLAAHSGPGQFMVSDVREKSAKRRDIASVAGRRLIAMVNSSTGDDNVDDGDFSYSMHGMKGMARLVETYMQPSRAIDDSDDDIGREKIIFQACHGASEVEAAGIDDNGEKIHIGMESIISQIGSDLVSSGVKAKIDIYGAAGGIQLMKNKRGVHYTGQPPADFMDGRPHLPAQRIRIQDGALAKEEVYDIPLRKTA